MASAEQTIDIRIDAASLAAIERLTDAISRMADEMEAARRDDCDEPTDVIEPKAEPLQVKTWQT